MATQPTATQTCRANEQPDVLGIDRIQFYRTCIDTLKAAGVETLVGGAYALRYFTGIARDTKDLDLFLRPRDVQPALDALRAAGFETEVTSPAWLAKASYGAMFIDLIFRSGNGTAQVDDLWFERAETMRLFDTPIGVTPIEEMIWSKAFTMERERFDLADVVHLIQARGEALDWPHLVNRFGKHWRVLLAHIILFQFAFPCERDAVPPSVIVDLIGRIQAELAEDRAGQKVCHGTLLSGTQFLVDTVFRGYSDGRFDAANTSLSEREIRAWKKALDQEQARRLKEAQILPPAMRQA